MIFWGLFLSALANLSFGFARSFLSMAGIWMLNGCFQSMLWCPIIRIISTVFSKDQYNKITPVLMLATVSGYLLAWGLSGYLSERIGWQYAMWIPAILLGIYSLLWYTQKNRIRTIYERSISVITPKQQEASSLTQKVSTKSVLSRAGLWPVLLASFCQGIIKDGISLWVPVYFLARFQFSFSQTVSFILMIPLMNAIGVFFAGWVNTQMQYQERKTAAILFILSFIILVAIVLLPAAGIALTSLLVAIVSGLSYGTNSILLSFLPLKCSIYGKSSAIAGLMDFCSYLGVASSSLVLGYIVAQGHISLVPVSWLLAAIGGTVFMLLSQRRQKV